MKKITNIKLAIGRPLNFPMVYAGYHDAFLRLEMLQDFIHLSSNADSIIAMRNDLVVQARGAGASHLIQMDVDMSYHPQTITRLLSHRLPVVGALAFRRWPPFDPLMMRGRINRYKNVEHWEKDELVEVDATGAGCLLCSMEVFDAIEPPWFEPTPSPSGERGHVGEDFAFCTKLKEAGYDIFVDTAVPAGHLTFFVVTEETWRLYTGLKKIQGKDRHKDTKSQRKKL